MGLPEALNARFGALFDTKESHHLFDMARLDGRVPAALAVRSSRETWECLAVVCDGKVVLALPAFVAGSASIEHCPDFFESDGARR
jgi:hypothetical protein